MDQFFGVKELYHVALKAPVDMVFGERRLEAGEPVTYFEHIQIASLSENIKPVAARGGKRNDALVIWEDRQDVTFRMTSGVVSDVGFALLTNAKVTTEKHSKGTRTAESEIIELNDVGIGKLEKHLPAEEFPVFCFIYSNKLIQKKISNFTVNYDTGEIDCGEEYANCTILVDYYFWYGKTVNIHILERDRFNGLFELEGKYYRKGEMDGLNRTTLFRMPKVRIASSLSLTMGELASPTLSNFNIVATPTKTEYSDYSVVEIFNFDEDIQ